MAARETSAADNFLANKPASDGVGLLDHYEKMWEEIAKVLSDCPNVIELEPMNEPFMGSIARNAFGLGTMKMMEKNPAFDLARPDLIPPEQAAEFMQIVASQLLDFDRTTLMDFYRRMQRAIQKTGDLIRHMNGIVEKYLWGSAYCEYRPGMEKDGHFPAFRPGEMRLQRGFLRRNPAA